MEEMLRDLCRLAARTGELQESHFWLPAYRVGVKVTVTPEAGAPDQAHEQGHG